VQSDSQRGQGNRPPRPRLDDGTELKDQVITIRRVTKVVKGGKNLSFAALVAVGDERGQIGIGKAKAREVVDSLLPFAEKGIAIVGLEPSCLLTLRDELLVMGLGEGAQQIAKQALLFEEFLAREARAGQLEAFKAKLRPVSQPVLMHGHCHQKAFAAVTPVMEVLSLIPGAKPELIESSCCGMAGSFGYEAAHQEVSTAMAEASLLPAVRAAAADALIVADGTSCRHQIHDGAQRQALHVARVLEMALPEAGAARSASG